MNITPEELTKIQKKAATDALASLVTIKPKEPLECSVIGQTWRTQYGEVHFRVAMNLAGKHSELTITRSEQEFRDDATETCNSMLKSLRGYIDAEVERNFYPFILDLVSTSCKIRNPSKKKP